MKTITIAKISNADKVAIPSVALSIFCWSILVNWRLRLFVPDDAYIHTRIASHLAATGHGWFNLGERVMVTSSPLWTVLLAALFGLLGERPWILPVVEGLLLSATWALGSFIIIISLERALSPLKRALVYGAVFLLVTALLGYCGISQMETVLAVCLVFGAVAGFLVESDWAPTFLVLSAFTRYEMVLTCATFLVVTILLRRLSQGACLKALGVAVVGVVFLLAQYHTVIPNSVRAKAAGYTIDHSSMALNLLWDGMTNARYGAIILAGSFAVLVVLGLAVFELLRTPRKELRHHWPIYTFFASAMLVLLAYFSRPTLLFSWYRPLYTVPIAFVVLYWAFQRPRSPYPVAAFVLLIATWGYHYWMVMPGIFKGEYGVSPNFVEVARVHRYLTIGRTLNAICPGSSLLSSEIGGLGESFHGTIIDGFGLATPEAIKFQPLRIPEERSAGFIGGFSAGIVDLKKPDIIVTYDIFAKSFLRSALVNDYERMQIPLYDPPDRAQVREKGLWGYDTTLLIFLRKDSSCHFDPTALQR